MGARWRERVGDTSTLWAVPSLLFALDGISTLARGAATEYVLVPPLAVIIFLVFSRAERADTRLRAVVLLPALSAAVGELGYVLLGATPWGVAAVALAVLVAQRIMRAHMPPALAIAVLAMLVRPRGPWYALDVAAGTTVVWVTFRVWRSLAPHEGGARRQET